MALKLTPAFSIPYSGREGSGFLPLQPDMRKHRPITMNWLSGGVCKSQGPNSTTEIDLALSLLYVSKMLFHLVLDCLVFLQGSDAKIQWASSPGTGKWYMVFCFLGIDNLHSTLLACTTRKVPYLLC